MRTLVDILQRMPALGTREAVRWRTGYRTGRLSYGDLYARVGGCTAWLARRGVERGDRVLLWGPNRPEWVLVFWACVARGVHVVPIDERSSPAWVARLQEQVRARLIVSGQDSSSTASAFPDTDCATFADVWSLTPQADFDTADVTPEDVVEIVFTSGTTGDPKGVVHRHANICANLRPIAREIQRLRLALRLLGTLRLLDLLPLSHMFGQSIGVFLPVLLRGTSVFSDELSPGAVLDTVHRESVTAVAVVPRMLESLQREAVRRHDNDNARATDVRASHAPATDARGEEPRAALDERAQEDADRPVERHGVDPADRQAAEPQGRFLARVWEHRKLHGALGWRFWFFVVGGAAVHPRLESFWARRGFIVVQGYGLTETSPIVAFNHPLRAQRGSIGEALPGLEVRIASDGEILVRGPSVVSEYWTQRGAEAVTDADGWLHTGDVGRLDADGRLYYQGRKKDVIVVADGTNVYPPDVEAQLDAEPDVRGSAVVGVGDESAQSVHAALLLEDPNADVEGLVRRVNARLEPHQRVRSWSLWPDPDFPRTPSTAKVKRMEVARAVQASRDAPPMGSPSAAALRFAAHASVEDIFLATVASVAQRDVTEIRGEQSLEDDLGLASLDRVELLSALEHALGMDLDEMHFAALTTVAELQKWIAHESGRRLPERPASHRDAQARGTATHEVPQRKTSIPAAPREPRTPAAGVQAKRRDPRHLDTARDLPLPRWRSRLPVTWVRRVFQDGLLVPAVRAYFDLAVEGRENLDDVQPPVLFAANHTSHLDTPVVLAALPGAWRRRIAPAMMSEYFRDDTRPGATRRRSHGTRQLQFHAACALLNAFPIPQRMGGIRRVLQYMGEQVDQGACPLVFPEGGRSRDGNLKTFKPGIGLMSSGMHLPVVPIHLDGVFDALPPGSRRPRRGRIRVRIGAALRAESGLDHRAAARRVEDSIRSLAFDATPRRV